MVLNMTEAAKDRFIYLIIFITPCTQVHRAHAIQSQTEAPLTGAHRLVQVYRWWETLEYAGSGAIKKDICSFSEQI